ncbi:glycogen debranching protein [Rubripirellula reticaptiva]|uniref:Glycogen debranching enzyme n=1 Tax=Rubripirellula reticaptiva TaxID=2528013 RepID=A0A5C6EDY5_9BACT|nr:isoamylase [Rubripirellula reticaptiva]TWU46654.1 Glycogen debranching enzyme [Rubripirellula reticaptiva]
MRSPNRPSWASQEGSPFPLGVSFVAEDDAFNFAIYSKHSDRVTLLLFADDETQHPIVRVEFDYLRHKTGSIWHCRLSSAEVDGATFYGYQIDGPPPGEAFEFHRFDYEKILLDPYAHAVHFPVGFSREAARRPGSNAGRAALGWLPHGQCHFDWGDDVRPRHDSDLVIYELHVRGFTQHASSDVDSARRGTFLGVCDKIPYLVELGVTAVELMPVFQFDPDDGNYWGYMPLALFAPHHRYTSHPQMCRQRDEFRTMVKELHAAGIEVILDVVYNHTCEGDDHGPVYSFKGIDNSTYYVASGDQLHPFANHSGTGNTLHTANRTVRRLVVDSMRYWVEVMHVDGFRFDLASIFTRDTEGNINADDPPIIGQIGAEDELACVRLIAEPWDASGTFQLGKSFPGMQWMQWNANFRECLQRFVRGDRGMVGELMTRVYGSCDLFPDDRMFAYRPYQSVNYIASHDGFTIADLVSYATKSNWANGENNTDGASEFSCNCGWEGCKDVPVDVLRNRKQRVKNFFALLMLSAGTPMFRMGDEFLNTQNGNSNPYNQDNETNWLDWRQAETNHDMLRFVRMMIAFRKAHPSICRSRFWRDDIKWYGTDHLVDLSPGSTCLAYSLHGATERDSDLYVMINGGDDAATFGIQEGSPGTWRRVIETSLPSPNDIVNESDSTIIDDTTYSVAGHSVVVLMR